MYVAAHARDPLTGSSFNDLYQELERSRQSVAPDELQALLEARIDALRDELNAIVAGACPTCALSVQQLTQPFVSADEAAGDAAGDWAV